MASERHSTEHVSQPHGRLDARAVGSPGARASGGLDSSVVPPPFRTRTRGGVLMGLALEWYRREICQREGHTHGEAGELDCILQRLAEIRARQLREGQSSPWEAGQ